MITHWLSRAFGSTENGDGTPGLLGLTKLAASPSSLVDSDELAAELARARRYERHLSIVVLSAQPVDEHAENGHSKLPQMIALLTAAALREVLRFSDAVCYHAAENRFVLGLTEVGPERAVQAMARIRTHLLSRLHLRTQAGLAAFPADAITLDELVSMAAWRAARDGTDLASTTPTAPPVAPETANGGDAARAATQPNGLRVR
jgi:hypothetical protein